MAKIYGKIFMLLHFISELVTDKTPKFAKRTTEKLQYLQDTTSYKGTSKLGVGRVLAILLFLQIGGLTIF